MDGLMDTGLMGLLQEPSHKSDGSLAGTKPQECVHLCSTVDVSAAAGKGVLPLLAFMCYHDLSCAC